MKKINGVMSIFIMSILFLLVLNSGVFAEQEQEIDKRQICGDHLDLIWEKVIVDNPTTDSNIEIGVHPSGKNYWTEVTYWGINSSSDTPIWHVNIMLDSQGKELWRKDGYIDLPFVIAGNQGIPVKEQLYKTYDRINNPFDKSLRYHIWFDSNGYIISVHAQRYGLAAPCGKIEVHDKIIHNLEPYCQNGFCIVDRLVVTERGIDLQGWQTILRWPYPADSVPGTIYSAVNVGFNYLLINRIEPKALEQEWRLILVSTSENYRIVSETKYFLPIDSSTAFMKNKSKGFVWLNFKGREYTFMRLDEAGRVIEKKRFNLSREFGAFIQSISEFKNGWIVQNAGLKEMLRLLPDGSPKWLNGQNNEAIRLVGNTEDALFFAVKNKLYMCREK